VTFLKSYYQGVLKPETAESHGLAQHSGGLFYFHLSCPLYSGLAQACCVYSIVMNFKLLHSSLLFVITLLTDSALSQYTVTVGLLSEMCYIR